MRSDQAQLARLEARFENSSIKAEKTSYVLRPTKKLRKSKNPEEIYKKLQKAIYGIGDR